MTQTSLPLLFLAMVAPLSALCAQPADNSRMLFFDWGKAELTGDAKATLDRIAEEFRASGKGQILLQSSSDRSGPASANLRMSRKRADSAADYLAGKGIARSAIRIEALGESRPLIETQDGVREVQNRRIDVRFVDRQARN